jgi:hypothetical protein
MTPLSLTPEQAAPALAALRAVARADGALGPEERQMLELQARDLGFQGALRDLPILDLDALAAAIPEAEQRTALVQRLVMMAMLDGEVVQEEIEQTKQIARYLRVKEQAVRQMEEFLDGKLQLLAYDLVRRAPTEGRSSFTDLARAAGLKGMVRRAGKARSHVDDALAAPYRGLSAMPEGSLGRAIHAHFTDNGFPFPGQKDGVPAGLLFHELGHVLSGYGTDPDGEVLLGAFEAGYMGDDGFAAALRVLYTFHLGAQIDPNETASQGHFRFDTFQVAFRRGTAVHTDLRSWDPWPHMGKPLGEVRAALGVPDEG